MYQFNFEENEKPDNLCNFLISRKIVLYNKNNPCQFNDFR